jgi:hypothetical protein
MFHTDTIHTIEGFISAQGKEIVDEKGRRVLLRGVGLGSWLLPEGYMWKMPAAADRPRRIEKLILDLVGPRRAAEFWEQYWDNFITEQDVKQIAAEGFNSLRLPMNARYLTGSDDSQELLESRMARIDSLIQWCRSHRVYIILDLHGAPGGQTGTNIDDSQCDQPDLFRFQENEDRTVNIWRSIAKRYKDEEIIAGYDLLNEPLPNWFSEYNKRLLPLYRRLTAAIRGVDPWHLIILEGVHWATDWSVFEEPFDDNVMLQFHKYWNNPDRESIAPYLKAREKWNVPIFMGEGGENNTDWYSGAFRLFEDLDISWNFWTWKKISTHNSPVSIKMPEGWKRIAQIATSRPGSSVEPMAFSEPVEKVRFAWSVLKEYAENVKFSNCEYHPEVVGALFRRPAVRIPAIFYSYQDRGIGFDHGVTQQSISQQESIDFRRNDGMLLGYVDSHNTRVTPNFAHNNGEAWEAEEWMYVQLESGGWAAYDFYASHKRGLKAYTVTLHMRSESEASVQVSNGEQIRCIVLSQEVENSFKDYSVTIEIRPGLQRVKIMAESFAVQLQWLHVTIAD